MPRKLKRFIQIDTKILDVKNEFILVYTEEHFSETIRQNPDKKNIHYLLKDNQNLSFFLYRRSLVWENH